MSERNLRKHNILVVGSSNIDMVIKTNHLPRPGETVLGGTFFMNPGGKVRIKQLPLRDWEEKFHLFVKQVVTYLDISLSNYLKKKA